MIIPVSVPGVSPCRFGRMFNSYDKSTLFWDTMHLSLKGHALIAKLILETVRKLRVREGRHRWGWKVCAGRWMANDDRACFLEARED
jgi:hypothetical protein